MLAVLFAHIPQMTPARGALLGGLCWLGFAGATSYGTAIFSGTPKQLWLINTVYNLVCFVVVGVILAAWR